MNLINLKQYLSIENKKLKGKKFVGYRLLFLYNLNGR